MSAENLLASTSGSQALNIFGTGLIVFFVTVLIKYLTNVPLFVPNSTATAAEKRAAHFDSLRVGIDMSLLGFATYLAVTQIALENNMARAIQIVEKWNATIILAHLFLLIGAVLVTMLTNSPSKFFKRGIAFPFVLGWISLCISAAFFFYIVSNG
jgi:hypothetical protein